MVLRRVALVAALVLVATSCYKTFDFDNDNKADLVWVDGSNGQWYQADGAGVSTPTLVADGIPVAGDYDGDGRFEVAITAGSTWKSFGATPLTLTLTRPTGTATQIYPVPGMYDGHHQTLPAFYRDTDATWFIYGHAPIQFGHGPTNPNGAFGSRVTQDQDYPVPGDYDGDGITDLATYSPFTAMWHIRYSHDLSVTETSLSGPVGMPVPARYNGGTKDVPGVYSFDGHWIIDGHPTPIAYGDTTPGTTSFPTPADYDGDGAAEPAYVTLTTGATAHTDWHIFTRANPVTLTPVANSSAIPAELTFYLPIQQARLAQVGRCAFPSPPSSC